MRGLCLFVVLAAAIHASYGVDNKLYVKFGIGDPTHQSSYFELPRSIDAQAKADGWSIVEQRASDNVALACRDNNYQVCLLVDKKNSVAGLQLSASVADFEKTNAPVLAQAIKTTVLGTEVYSAIIYFVDQDVLKAGGRDITDDTPTAPNGFLVHTEEGLRAITLDSKDLAGTKFVRQECFPGMGRHYFYNMNKGLDCAKLDSFFALYNEYTNKVTGMGYISYANATVQADGRTWFEYVPGPIVKIISPDSPSCTTDFINQHGTHFLHIFVNQEPWNNKCSPARTAFIYGLELVQKLVQGVQGLKDKVEKDVKAALHH